MMIQTCRKLITIMTLGLLSRFLKYTIRAHPMGIVWDGMWNQIFCIGQATKNNDLIDQMGFLPNLLVGDLYNK